jgi:hypothetical protein
VIVWCRLAQGMGTFSIEVLTIWLKANWRGLEAVAPTGNPSHNCGRKFGK